MPRRSKEQILRDKNARWTLFMDKGYVLYTKCKACCEIKYCRGKTRDQMKCKECFLST